ncbi:MAG: hypothetical protein JWO31_4214 [Phycisphaerales bacterium]|nr:hypothetical protein [Phycisphaerales bacterium]
METVPPHAAGSTAMTLTGNPHVRRQATPGSFSPLANPYTRYPAAASILPARTKVSAIERAPVT